MCCNSSFAHDNHDGSGGFGKSSLNKCPLFMCRKGAKTTITALLISTNGNYFNLYQQGLCDQEVWTDNTYSWIIYGFSPTKLSRCCKAFFFSILTGEIRGFDSIGFFCMVKQFVAYLSPDDNSLFKSRLHFQHFSLMGCFSLGDRIELLLNWQMVTPHRLHEMRNSFFFLSVQLLVV